jgi:hypothetical protein
MVACFPIILPKDMTVVVSELMDTPLFQEMYNVHGFVVMESINHNHLPDDEILSIKKPIKALCFNGFLKSHQSISSQCIDIKNKGLASAVLLPYVSPSDGELLVQIVFLYPHHHLDVVQSHDIDQIATPTNTQKNIESLRDDPFDILFENELHEKQDYCWPFIALIETIVRHRYPKDQKLQDLNDNDRISIIENATHCVRQSAAVIQKWFEQDRITLKDQPPLEHQLIPVPKHWERYLIYSALIYSTIQLSEGKLMIIEEDGDVKFRLFLRDGSKNQQDKQKILNISTILDDFYLDEKQKRIIALIIYLLNLFDSSEENDPIPQSIVEKTAKGIGLNINVDEDRSINYIINSIQMIRAADKEVEIHSDKNCSDFINQSLVEVHQFNQKINDYIWMNTPTFPPMDKLIQTTTTNKYHFMEVEPKPMNVEQYQELLKDLELVDKQVQPTDKEINIAAEVDDDIIHKTIRPFNVKERNIVAEVGNIINKTIRPF